MFCKGSKVSPGFNVNDINEYFVTMGHGRYINRDLLEFFRNNKHENVAEEFRFKMMTENEDKSIINEIKSIAVGSDEISIQMIKAVIMPWER